VSEIEAIAKEDERVIDAYAIHAGREVRVFVNAQKITDAEAVLLSKEIAKKIETSVQYPGEIKVNLIREMRTTSTAR
jgi:ribonuclease Y